jgi:hypothetical protein
MPAWQGLWDNVHGATHALIAAPNARMRAIARLFHTPDAVAEGELAVTLTGAAVGQAASATVARVTASAVDGFNQGGQRAVSAESVVNRNTAAADETTLDAQFQPSFAPTTYPADLGGGGGGKLGTL